MNQDLLKKPSEPALLCHLFSPASCYVSSFIELGALVYCQISNPVPHPKAAMQNENNAQRCAGIISHVCRIDCKRLAALSPKGRPIKPSQTFVVKPASGNNAMPR
jgi:hypothetical protein